MVLLVIYIIYISGLAYGRLPPFLGFLLESVSFRR